MNRLLFLLAFLASTAFGQVTTNPSVTGAFNPASPGAIGATNPAAITGTVVTGTTSMATPSITINGGTALTTYVEVTGLTPVDYSGQGIALTSAAGKYIKVGKLVTVWMVGTYGASVSAATVKLGITGIPQSSADANMLGMCSITTSNTTIAMYAYFYQSDVSVGFRNAATNADITDAMVGGKTIGVTCQYMSAT